MNFFAQILLYILIKLNFYLKNWIKIYHRTECFRRFKDIKIVPEERKITKHNTVFFYVFLQTRDKTRVNHKTFKVKNCNWLD